MQTVYWSVSRHSIVYRWHVSAFKKFGNKCLASSPYASHQYCSPCKKSISSSALKQLSRCVILCSGMEGVGSGKMIPYSIAEGDEEEEWTEEDNGRLNITGHSSAILSELHVL